MNSSTFSFIGQTLKNTNRIALLRSRARLFCAQCQTLQTVTDFFPSGEALLECKHRRSVIDPVVGAEYEREMQKRPKGKIISKGSASAQLEIVREVSGEEAA
jgi:hypothetical protein